MLRPTASGAGEPAGSVGDEPTPRGQSEASLGMNRMATDSWPLAGVRVVELSRFVGAAYCGKLLGELGADVVAIEPPGGHPLRFRPIHPDRASTSLFDYLFTNKRITALDLDVPGGRQTLQALTDGADIIVTDRTLDEVDRLYAAVGGAAGLARERIVARIKPFAGAERGLPYTYFTAYHSGGESNLLPGGPQYLGRPPVTVAQYAGEYDSGLQAGIGALAALYARRAGLVGGDLVEVSVQGAVANMARPALGLYTADGGIESRAERGLRPGTILPCADGFIELMPQGDVPWQELIELMGWPEWAQRPEFSDPAGRSAHGAELNGLIGAWTAEQPKHELARWGQDGHLPSGPVETIDEVLGSEQLAFREFFRPSAAGGIYPALPFTLSQGTLPPVTECATIPAGQPIAWGDGERFAPTPGGGPAPEPRERPLPLAGIRVVEFSWYWAVPYTGLLLAALGAEVIKLESRARMDPMRGARVNVEVSEEHAHEVAVMYHDLNLGKRSLALDLTHPEAREIALGLVRRADVVLQNYAVGVLERLGLGFQTLREANPEAIIISETTSGEDGPTSHYRGFATIFSALSGLGDCTGYPDASPSDVRDGADLRVATTLGFATLGLLLRRQARGGGEVASLSAVESLARFLGEALTDRSRGGERYRRNANGDPVFCPNNCYPCAGEDRWIALSIRDDADWAALRRVRGLTTLDDTRFATAAGRRTAEGELDAIIGAWTAGHDAATLAAALQEAGVPASAVYTAEDYFADPFPRAAGATPVVNHPYLGRRAVVGTPWEFSELRAGVRAAAPLLGEANGYVMEELLGMASGTARELENKGVAK